MASTAKKHAPKMGLDIEQPLNQADFPDRDAKIAELAYYKSEHRDFAPGYELDDWLAAEQELTED